MILPTELYGTIAALLLYTGALLLLGMLAGRAWEQAGQERAKLLRAHHDALVVYVQRRVLPLLREDMLTVPSVLEYILQNIRERGGYPNAETERQILDILHWVGVKG